MTGEAARTTSYADTFMGGAAYLTAFPYGVPVPEPAPAPAPVKRSAPIRDTFIHPPRIELSAREKASLLLLVILAGVLFFGSIFVSAYCARLQKDINGVNAEAAAYQEEIDKLNIEIETGRNIKTIEKSAKKNLKMSYPSSDRIKYINKMKYNKDDLAQYLREKAYG